MSIPGGGAVVRTIGSESDCFPAVGDCNLKSCKRSVRFILTQWNQRGSSCGSSRRSFWLRLGSKRSLVSAQLYTFHCSKIIPGHVRENRRAVLQLRSTVCFFGISLHLRVRNVLTMRQLFLFAFAVWQRACLWKFSEQEYCKPRSFAHWVVISGRIYKELTRGNVKLLDKNGAFISRKVHLP